MEEVIKLGNIEEVNKHQSGNVYMPVGGVSPTLMAGTHGYGFGYFIEVIPIGDYDKWKIQTEST